MILFLLVPTSYPVGGSSSIVHFNFQRPPRTTPSPTPLQPNPAKHSRNLAATRRRNFNRFLKSAELHPMRLRFQSTSADRYEVARKERGQLSPTLPFPQELFQKKFKTASKQPHHLTPILLYANTLQESRFLSVFSRLFWVPSPRLGNVHRNFIRFAPDSLDFQRIRHCFPRFSGTIPGFLRRGRPLAERSNRSRILWLHSMMPRHTDPVAAPELLPVPMRWISDSG